MTQLIVAIAVVAAVVAVLCIVMFVRSRRDDEGERFRQVADLTSGWSRETHAVPVPESEREPVHVHAAVHEAAHESVADPAPESVTLPESSRPHSRPESSRPESSPTKRSRPSESADVAKASRL